MPRRNKMLELPAQATKDVKTVSNILDRWAIGVEDVLKDTFDWGKRHKLLVLLVVGVVAMKRYWLDEEDGAEDEDY